MLFTDGPEAWFKTLTLGDIIPAAITIFLVFFVIPAQFQSALKAVTDPKGAALDREAEMKKLEEKYAGLSPDKDKEKAPAASPVPAASEGGDDEECEIDMDTMQPKDPEKCL